MTYTFTEDRVTRYRSLRDQGMSPNEAASQVMDWDKYRLSLIQMDKIQIMEELAYSAENQSSEAVKTEDPVNHPSHYTQYQGLEIIDLVEQMNFNLGNAVKYITRAGFKDAAKTIEDLQKAVWYVRREIERLKKASSADPR